jgi:tetratricopeptide (TPR) repeat protein
LDLSQKIYGGTVIVCIGGQAVADFAYNRFDELLRSDLQFSCRLLQSAPDLRLLQRLRPELHRKQEPIDETFFRLSRLLGVKDELLPDVQKRIEQYQIKRNKALANFEKGDFVSDRNTLSLSLICADCGETNDYEVKRVSLAPEGGKHVIADELHCLSCGALSEFEFSAMATMTIMAEAVRIGAALKMGEKDFKPLLSYEQVRNEGKVQPLSVAYADLREKISINPNDSLSLFRLGNILAGIDRPKAALDCFRKAHTSNPLIIDAIINFAYALSNANQKQEAFAMLSNALKNSANWQCYAAHPTVKGLEFAQIYNQLLRELGRNDLPALHPGFLSAAPKVGRNDPCPCGSGKKFKKCCMK